MISVFVVDLTSEVQNRKIDPFMFRLTISVSVVYILLVLATILLQPFAAVGPIALLEMSNLWLGPIQGLAIGALGVFFVKTAGNQEPAE